MESTFLINDLEKEKMNKKQLAFCLLVSVFIFAVSDVSNGQQQGPQPQNTTEQLLDYIFGNKKRSEGNVGILLVPLKPGGKVKEFTVSPEEMAEYAAKAKKHNALTKAAAEGDINTIEKLLSSGYDINGKDEEDMTALMRAAKAGKKEMCEFLLSKKAGVYIIKFRKGGQDSALTFAVISGNIDIVNLILAASQDNIGKIVYGGTNALDHALGDAVSCAKPEMVRYLVDKGANVDAQFTDSNCVLSRAVASKNQEIVEFLLSKNVNVNPPEKIINPLMAAVRSKQTEIAKLLILKGASVDTGIWNKDTVLMEVAQTGDKEILDLLISKGAKLDKKNENGFTALMYAGLNGYREIAESLIMAGADLNIKNKNCNTFLMIAVRELPKETIELALSKGAEVNVKSCEEGFNEGVTPLIAALSRQDNDIDIAKLLIQRGADVNAKISWGTVLTLAGPSEEKVRLLLDNGADVNASSENGITALMMAVSYGRKNTVELLLSRGADAGMKDAEGNTAAMWVERGAGEGQISESVRKEILDLLSSQERK